MPENQTYKNINVRKTLHKSGHQEIPREKIRAIPSTQEHSFNRKGPAESRYFTSGDPWGKLPLVSYCQRVRGSRLHITVTQHRFQGCTGQVFISGPNEFVYWAKVLHATRTCWQQLWYSKEPVFSDSLTQYTMNSTMSHKNKRNTLGFTKEFLTMSRFSQYCTFKDAWPYPPNDDFNLLTCDKPSSRNSASILKSVAAMSNVKYFF